MRAKRRQFTLEFKLQAVRLANDSGKPIAQVARELGICAEMLRTWKRQAQSRADLRGTNVFPGIGNMNTTDVHNFEEDENPPEFPFNKTISVELMDEDTGHFPDQNDVIGTVSIDTSVLDEELSVDINGDGAKYTLQYQVSPA